METRRPFGPTRVLSRVLLAALGSLLMLPAPATAQTDRDVRLQRLFGGVAPSSPIQVVTPAFFVEDAFVEAAGERSVALSQNGTVVDIPYLDIRGVSVRDNHWLQGTLWGLGAGALFGGVGGLMYAAFRCSEQDVCERNERRATTRGAVFLGAAGAVGGFLIGRYSFYWRPVYP